jgi:hypothetical protein
MAAIDPFHKSAHVGFHMMKIQIGISATAAISEAVCPPGPVVGPEVH